MGNTVGFRSRLSEANQAGITTAIVKTYDGSNLSALEATITVTDIET